MMISPRLRGRPAQARWRGIAARVSAYSSGGQDGPTAATTVQKAQPASLIRAPRPAGYLALAAQSAWYSMPSDFISADFSAQAAFCFSGPRRSVILSHSLAAESSASFGDFRLARASVISNESLRWYSSAAGMTGSGTRYGKLAWMASRYLSASGNSLRNFSDFRWLTRQGSMIVLASMTILRLCSGSEMNSSAFKVGSIFFEYFETANARPGVMSGRLTILPSMSAPGTRPKPALPTMTDSAAVPPRLPVEVHE